MRNFRLPLKTSLVTLALLFIGQGAADEIRFEGNNAQVSANYFGMHIHRADTTTSWPIAPFSTWRLWDVGVSWERLEPAQDQWRFNRLDSLVSIAESHGVEPVLTLGITPPWAASRPNEKFVYGDGGNSPPRDMRDWEDYVRTVATRYKGRIRHFELWNEPTFDELDKGRGFYAGSASMMVELGKVAYRVIKEIDPENKLISPGFTDEGARLDLYLSLGGKEITDIVAHHFYAEKPELLPGYVRHVRKVLSRHQISHIPLWNTETGYWLPASSEKTSPKWPTNEAELGGYIARTLVMGAVAGLDRFYWYSWEKTMLNNNAKTSQTGASIVSYMQAIRWLRGASVKFCNTLDRRLWVCELTMGTRVARIAWSAKEDFDWIPPSEWKIRHSETLDARLHAIQAGDSLKLTAVPVLLKSESALWTNAR